MPRKRKNGLEIFCSKHPHVVTRFERKRSLTPYWHCSLTPYSKVHPRAEPSSRKNVPDRFFRLALRLETAWLTIALQVNQFQFGHADSPAGHVHLQRVGDVLARLPGPLGTVEFTIGSEVD